MSNTKALRSLARSETTKPISIALKPKGRGSLVARKVSTGVRFYYQYKFNSKLSRVPFGSFDERGDKTGSAESQNYTIDGAIKRAQALAELAEKHGDLTGYLSQRQADNAAAIAEAKEQRELEALSAARYSLEKLCYAYTDHLTAAGKVSAPAVRNSLKNWVIDRHPTLAKKKAAEITTDDIMLILRTIVDAGHKTTVNRVRSYLSAAYGFGIGSGTNPLLSSKAGGFRLKSNPVAGIVPVAEFESTSDRVLTESELTMLLRAIQSTDRRESTCVELSLRLGAQRISQLLAATPDDVDEKNGTLRLKDTKGRRVKPRIHLLPIDHINPDLIESLKQQHRRAEGAFGGLSLDTVSKHVAAISDEGDGGHFTWRDVRRTVETMLASMGVSKDIRAHIQSHGLGGVQDKHYDRYTYMPEKKAALKAWNDKLDALLAGNKPADNVVQINGQPNPKVIG